MEQPSNSVLIASLDPKPVDGLTESEKLEIAINYQKTGDALLNAGSYDKAYPVLITASEMLIKLAKTSQNHTLVEALKEKLPFLFAKVRHFLSSNQ